MLEMKRPALRQIDLETVDNIHFNSGEDTQPNADASRCRKPLKAFTGAQVLVSQDCSGCSEASQGGGGRELSGCLELISMSCRGLPSMLFWKGDAGAPARMYIQQCASRLERGLVAE